MIKKQIIKKSISLLLLLFLFMCLGRTTFMAANERTEITNIIKNPDFIKETLNPNTTETYEISSRKFQRMSGIIQYGNRIYAAWTAGGNTEPHNDNYVVVAYSDDKGKTWVDPYLVIDPLDYGSGDKAQLPSFWINPDGILFLYYSCNKSGYKYIISQNADATDINDVVWSIPRVSNSGGAYMRPTTLSNGNVLLNTQGADQTKGIVYMSANKGATWTLFSEISSSAGTNKRFNESQIVELSDGRLMYLARLENPEQTGGLERAYSSDFGVTWTQTEYNLPYPLRSAASRTSFNRLANGNLIFITNDSGSTLRTNLTIFMSEDDGETWPYSLLLDDRYPISYPDAAQGKDGSIAIIYDCGGNVGSNPMGLCEIRSALITEEDIKAGKIVNENSYLRGIIAKSDSGLEIKSINEEIDYNMSFSVGKTSGEIISLLPSTITITTNDNNTHTFSGTWSSNDFLKDQAGTYVFSFQSSDWNTKNIQDNYSLLRVRVNITSEASNPGDNINPLPFILGAVGIVVVATIIAVVLKTKRKGKKSEKK